MSCEGETSKLNWRRSDSTVRRLCMLMVTHACNLNCTYCYEAFKSDRKMSLPLAKRIIEKEAGIVRNSPLYRELEIDFMGGEPLVNFQLIREVVEWLEGNPLDVPVICFASTNGTLLDEERQDWFSKHRDMIWLSLSYDGDERMQNGNRGTGGYAIDLDFFQRNWPLQGVQMTISKETLPRMAEGVLQLQRRGMPVTVSLAQGVNWSRKDALVYQRELQRLADAYMADPDLKPCSRLMRMVWTESPCDSSEQSKFCGSGVHMRTYDVDGREYGCHLFTPVVLGSRALELSSLDLNCKAAYSDARCRDCILRNFCGTCAGFNFLYRGSPATRDFSFCLMELAEAKVSCNFQVKLMVSRLSRLGALDAQYAKAAIKAHEQLRRFSVERDDGPFVIEADTLNDSTRRTGEGR